MPGTVSPLGFVRKCSPVLENPFLWELARLAGDALFQLYRNRFRLMREWDVPAAEESVLEIGCGIGHYSRAARGPYVGIDLHERYIRYASRRNAAPNRAFRCVDAAELDREGARFDTVLIVDVIHHLDDETAGRLLRVAGALARRQVLIFEPLSEQPKIVGRWLVEHDRGEFVRPERELFALLARSGLAVRRNAGLWLGPINSRAILAAGPARHG